MRGYQGRLRPSTESQPYHLNLDGNGELTVWLLTFGCQILVSNFMIGGRKGYSVGIFTSILYVPPSYGVPGGPLKDPLRCVKSSPLPTGSACICDVVSAWISAISLVIRRIRFVDMVGGRLAGQDLGNWKGLGAGRRGRSSTCLCSGFVIEE